MKAKSILVIDDSRSIRLMMAHILSTSGYHVVEAVDGKDGWEKAQVQVFDMVLTDQYMPNGDGIWLIKALRNSESYRNVPILMITMEASDEMKVMVKAAGATGLIVKPFDSQRLIELVKKTIGETAQ